MAAVRNLADIVLIDIVEGLAEGKALDIGEAGPVQLYDSRILGTTDWKDTADSDIVIVTSGVTRKPGMSRDDLLAKNVQIVKDVSRQIARHSPESFVILVSNPLDAMVYTAAKVTDFPKNKIMGMAGALDSARFSYFLARELGVSVESIKTVLMGGHGDDMVPLPRFTCVSGIPIAELLDQKRIDGLIGRTRKGGIEVVNLLGTSAYYKTVMSCCAYCVKEYDVGGYFVGVPVVLGKKGVEKVVELNLTESEHAQFSESLSHVKQLTEKVDGLL
jgi:malate dehydrogenase